MVNPEKLIEEVRKRPGLYNPEKPLEKLDKLELWKSVGSAIYKDWDTLNKAEAYDRVLQLQRKWKSLKDAYNRELRARRTGNRINRKVYVYYKKMSFLGGAEGLPEPTEIQEPEEDETNNAAANEDGNDVVSDSSYNPEPLPKLKRKKIKRSSKRKFGRYIPEYEDNRTEEVEMPMQFFPVGGIDEQEMDSDKLFLLSFHPEMKKLPSNIKMWARAQIAKVMQEAVGSQFSNTQPGTSSRYSTVNVKTARKSSTEE